jgi:hypothetical protein
METPKTALERVKELFEDKSEVEVADALKTLGLESQEELEKLVSDSRIYELNSQKDRIVKKQIVRFKLVILKTEQEVSVPVAQIIPSFEKLFQYIPYLRFNKTKGHMILFEEDFQKVSDIWNLKVSVKKDEENNQTDMTLNDPNYEDRRIFSNEHGRHMEGILRSKFGKHVHFAIDGITVYKNGIYLGVQKFKSLKELKSVFGKLLKNGKEGERIENPEHTFLIELLKFHAKADEKLKEVDHFEVGFHPTYKDTKCFLIVKHDGTKEDFSFNKCIKQISTLING